MLVRLIVFAALVGGVFQLIGNAQEAAQTATTALGPIFDGETIDGWNNPYDWGKVTVVDGEVHLVADKKFFLVTDKLYHDFIFEGEMRLPQGKANSGFMLRGQESQNRVFGYQAEIDASDRKWSGGLYDEGRRKWLNPLSDQPGAQNALNRDQWNKYRIVCDGDHIQIFVNDIPTTDYYDPVDLVGNIGIQHHGERGQLYRFRNLKAQETGRHVWKPIFNGENLDGWKPHGGGNWTVTDGVLIGKSPASESKHGLLLSEKSYRDFTVRITFRVLAGNSGFYFRSEPQDDVVGIAGIQSELENSDLVGGLYETGGRGWIVKPLHYFPRFAEDRQSIRTAQWAKARQVGDWSTMVVSAHGDRIVTHVNDILASDIVDPKGSKEGVFALQLHSGIDMDLEVKAIEMLEKAEL